MTVPPEIARQSLPVGVCSHTTAIWSPSTSNVMQGAGQ
jgi:hypothetical protein